MQNHNNFLPFNVLPMQYETSSPLYGKFYFSVKAMKIKILKWHAVASWTWDAQDETCGICRMAFDGCCPDCKFPGDDCPLIWGACLDRIPKDEPKKIGVRRLKMDSSRRQSGIQQLLAAEQEAQHIVNEARNAKLARLKQAKEEAEKEVAAYRAQMEAEFQRKLAQSSGDSGANVKRLEQETDEKIQHLNSQAENISHDVAQMLLKHVTTVKN
ncbi:hypothetical protein ZIOFF_032851 [Zingiber officinale]|uniref:Anaphase-promoting complex subunit 11 RING-H2 finger domain-containing protein n=2 Tax=Zingiber officinale TaxID=94328 RepID=A0A8J5LBI8_ZINOF|nr:hypothetical protein ZIOFF_032851 [Zingiber officinale]